MFFIAMLSIVVRSYNSQINSELARERNFGNFAAMVLVGIFAECLIVGMDIAAVYYVYTKQYEYKDYHLQHTVNLFVTAITLAFDGAVGLFLLLCLIYLWCSLYHRDATTSCPQCRICPRIFLEIFLSCCVIPCFYAIFGNVKQAKGLEMPENYERVNRADAPVAIKTASQRTSWILLTMLIAPLFSLASHSGYILVAWLTQPSQTTATALFAFALILIASLILRQCYKANADIELDFRCWSIVILVYPFIQCGLHVKNVGGLMWSYLYSYKYREEVLQDVDPKPEQVGQVHEGRLQRGELTHLLTAKPATLSEKPFNTQAFCIVMGWSILVVGGLAFIVISFYEIPFQTLDLLSYLLNIFQIFIVIITLLITYKIFMLGEPDIQRFFKQIRKTYKAQHLNQGELTEVGDVNVEDIEATGAIAGKALDTVIRK